MKRKIISLAKNTLVVSIPTSWAKEQGLSKGDEVDCDVLDTKLILTPNNSSKNKNVVSIDIKGINERVLRWKISSLHKQGFDEIEILSYSSEQYAIIEDLVKNLFVGFIVKDKSSLRIVIGQVAVIDASEFDTTLRRAFRLLNTMCEELIFAFEKKDSELLFHQLDNEQNNNKLTNFCERLLNGYLTQKQKGHFWYIIVWNLEKVADNFKYIANHYTKIPKVSDDVIQLLKDLKDFINSYYECFYNFSYDALVEISNKKKFLSNICLDLMQTENKDSIILLHYVHMIIMQMVDFSASMIAIRMDA